MEGLTLSECAAHGPLSGLAAVEAITERHSAAGTVSLVKIIRSQFKNIENHFFDRSNVSNVENNFSSAI